MKHLFIFILSLLFFCACTEKQEGQRIVICIPVYGQSLALGEEAERITDFDSLTVYAEGRIVTENLDHTFGYFDNDATKQWLKKMVGYKKRAYELSIYNMAKIIADHTGNDTIICIFPGGQGATALANLSKGTQPYQVFINSIEKACYKAHKYGWTFTVPAICWMQGESDIVDYPSTNYRQLLTQIWHDMNTDILQITQQTDSIPFVCYQSNSLARAVNYDATRYHCVETDVPQTFVQLLQSDDRFWASGPTYPYSCVNEKIHIDAHGQQIIGAIAANTVLSIIHHEERFRGLIPTEIVADGHDVIIHLNVPQQPIFFDTIQVKKASNMGFSVITTDNRNIIESTAIQGCSVVIKCKESPAGCQIRYAVNGDYMKSGNQHGPRGNLRDAAGNWCYQFNIGLNKEE